MRSINTTASSDVQVSLPSSEQTFVQYGQDMLEMRFTVKKSNSEKTLFYFGKCGMRRNSKNGNLFGEFRPFPLMTEVQGGTRVPSLDSNGNQKVGAFWAKFISLPQINLTAEEQMQFNVLSKRPDLLDAGFPVADNVRLALHSSYEYEEANLKDIFQETLGYTNIKFKFNVPQQFHTVIENLQKLVEAAPEKQYYSLVIRFSMAGTNIRSKDEGPLPEYSTPDVDVYHLYINEVAYVGYLKGATLDEREELRHIDFSESIRKVREMKKEKPQGSQPFTKQEIQTWADKVRAKAASIKGGNKGHFPLRDEYISAAKEGNTELAQLALDALKAKAEEGTHTKVTPIYVETLAKENPIVEVKEELVSTPVVAIDSLDELSDDDLFDSFDD